MSTSTVHPHRNLYLREIEEGFEELEGLVKDGFYNIPKITWWILRYEELYDYSYTHRHVGSCIEGMGCGCSWDNPESKFSHLYPALQEIIELHQYEKYFKEEMATLENVRHDHPALMQWLKKNEKLGAEEFILFWIEWYEEEKQAVIPFILNCRGLEIKFKAAEWQHTIRFLEVFNEIYWTSDAFPNI